MSDDRRKTKEEVERIISAETYDTIEEALAAAQAISDPGGVIQIHRTSCDESQGCTCEPIVIVHRGGEGAEA